LLGDGLQQLFAHLVAAPPRFTGELAVRRKGEMILASGIDAFSCPPLIRQAQQLREPPRFVADRSMAPLALELEKQLKHLGAERRPALLSYSLLYA
jgi:hypothetical protein